MLATWVELEVALTLISVNLVAFEDLISVLTALLISDLIDDLSTKAYLDAFKVLLALAVEFDSILAMIFSSGTGVFSSPV